MDPQTAAFWLAVIGAAAWIPQIVGWVWKTVARPVVRVIPAASLEIGFTQFGPIVNLPIAILVKRKDALITQISLRAIHQNGEAHELQWMWIHEVVSYIRGLPANMNLAKQDRAIALAASLDTLLSKTIGFQDSTFQMAYREKATALTEQYKFLKDREHGREQFLNCRELALGLEWFSNSMFWTEGNYGLEIELKVEGLNSRVRAKFQTTLEKPEIDLLRQNIEKMKQYVTALVNADAQGQAVPEPTWNWIFPALSV